MRLLTALVMLIGLGSVPSTAMANRVCSPATYERADASLVNAAGSWGSLLRHQKTFASCDDGALAEGYSDAVVTLFAHRWDQFDAFVALSGQSRAFGRWVIRHIDASASPDDLKKVVHNAARCTGSAETKDLCGEVSKAARDALKD